MRRRLSLISSAIAVAVLLVGAPIAPTFAASTPAASISPAPATPAASISPAPATPHAVPPAAPSPTSSGKSPDAPDPHPPAGGVGPDGELVGGAALAGRGLVTPATAPAPPADVDAQSWIVVDLDSGTVLGGRDVHGRYQPASILKLLTAATILPGLPANRTVTVSASAANAEGSKAGLLAGGSYSIDNLFSGLLLVSGNDTAAALAEAYGGVAKTVTAMNAEALALGAYDTFVQTPSGLDGWQQLTSAYDMALFLRAAVAQPRFVAYDRQPSAVLPAQHVGPVALDPVTLTNQTNDFLTRVPGAILAKIGFTDAAQHTYVCAAERDGHRLGVVLLRAQKYPVDQWQQAASLLDWAAALPAGTAPVGQLDTAVPTAPGPGTTTHIPTTASLAASRSSHSLAPIGLAVGAIVLALGVPMLAAGVAHRRRRPRDQRLRA